MNVKEKICKECKESKRIFSQGMCLNCHKKTHPEKYLLKKTTSSLKRDGMQQKMQKESHYQKKIKSISESQKERLKEYNILRIDYLKNNPICECCRRNRSTEIHHKGGRDGDNLFQHFLAVCRDCHRFIEENPIWAKEMNFSISRLKKDE